MKRQNLRKLILIFSFLLFPITIYYLSPYLIIHGAAEGVIVGSFIVFALMLLSSMFFGRLFCGWLCPAGGLQECCRLASDKKAKGGKLDLIKYFIWAPWILLIVFISIKAGGLKKIDFLYQTFHGISISEPQGYIIYYGVVLLIAILAITSGRRSFCHYVCWMAPFMVIGRKLSGAVKIPSIKLAVEKEKCIGCKQCNAKCPMSLEIDQMVKKGSIENPECILCGECSDVCARRVIHYSFKNENYSKNQQSAQYQSDK